jgi:hypothetical protein
MNCLDCRSVVLVLAVVLASPVTQADEAWERIAECFTPPPAFAGDTGSYASPLVFADGSRVETPADWPRRRAEILATWKGLLGQWPEVITEPEVEILETHPRGELTQQKVRFLWTPRETTDGYLLLPPGDGPHPAVLVVFYEPETAIGLGKSGRDFALRLARRGFVTLSIGTTEATAAKTYSLYWPSIDDANVQPLSMLAYAAANAFHVLASRPEVDPQRIGVVGHSFGGKWAMFAACLYEPFACAAWSDPGIVFDTRPSVNYWEPWYLGWHPRPWRKRGVPTAENPARGLYPQLLAEGHDLHELHALMPPRPFFVAGGSEDPPHRWQPLNHTVAINSLLGFEHRVGMHNRDGHDPTPESNAAIDAFFVHTLKPTQRGARRAGEDK